MTESRKPRPQSLATWDMGPMEPLTRAEIYEDQLDDSVVAQARSAVIAAAIDESAGAWSEENHPDLVTREDVVRSVRETRAELDQEVQRRTALRTWNLGLGTKQITRGGAYDDTALPEDDASNKS